MTTVKRSATRKFCTLPEDVPVKTSKYRSSVLSKNVDSSKLMKYIDENVIGRNTTFLGPFGRRKVVYCDYAASGRSLQFIEDYIMKEVLPLYGNTHTSTNVTALQSNFFRHEARDVIRNAVHASEDDVVIFAGHGCTSAIYKLIHALDLNQPPVVFVGPSEHSSILLPWQEIGAKVIRISETKEGFLDLVDLELKLNNSQKVENPGTQLIGCFTASSNITGILADDIATTILLHQYGALSFWDYATSAPYVPLDMNPLLTGNNDKAAYKDAIFFSGHKFIGGVQSPGVLIVKKRLFQSSILEKRSSEEAVSCVSRDSHRYLRDIEIREECSTAAIIESVRIGLAMHLKQTVGPPNIISKEEKTTKTVLSFLRTIPEIIILGNSSRKIKRLSVFSFLVKHPRGMFLHHNFICAILNDIFGIQARGGCVCDISYAHDLLGIDEDLTDVYENLIEDGGLDHNQYEMLRPGFTRISLPYFISDNDLTFILEAIKMVATEGWKLLPQYVLYPEKAEWKHRSNMVFRDRKWLGSIRYVDGKMTVNERKISGQSPFPQDSTDCLQMARNVFNKARRAAHRYPMPDQMVLFDKESDKLRWFMLPNEAQDLLLGNGKYVKNTTPFDPSHCFNSSCYLDSDCNSVCSTATNDNVLSPLFRHNSMSCIDITNVRQKLRPEKAYSDCGSQLLPYSDIPDICRSMSPVSRVRCYSLESSACVPPRRLLLSTGQRQCSCSSQTDISDTDSAVTKDGYLSGEFSESGDMGINNLFPSSDRENIQAYVKGVTEELATEIKTEIRGVIATVDTALSESMENLDPTNQYYDKRFSVDSKLITTSSIGHLLPRNNSVPIVLPNYNYRSASDLSSLSVDGHEDGSILYMRKRIPSYNSNTNLNGRHSPESSVNGSVSDQVAVYLAELTSEMVTEMKSEFREMVNAVDEIISPSNSTEKQHVYSTESSTEKDEASANRCCKNNLFSYPSNEKCDTIDKEEEKQSDENESIIESNLELISNGITTECDKLIRLSDSSNDSGVAGVGEVIVSKQLVTKVNAAKNKNPMYSRQSPIMSSTPPRKTSLYTEKEIRSEGYEEFLSCTLENRKRSFESISINPKWHCPPKSVWKPMVEAVREFDMIREGDRILVCLSGGKDSLSLLHALHQYQYYSQSNGVNFTIGAVTVDPGSSAYNPRPLIPYLHALGVHYLYEELRILEKTEEINCRSIYSFCSKLKRDRFYKSAIDNNYSVLALGQHLDDCAESFLMSAFHNGQLRSIKAHYYISNRDLRVIRPLIYVREKYLRQFAENRKLPVIFENGSVCVETPKERHRTKQLLAQQEILHPKLFSSLRSAIHPLITFRRNGKSYRNRKPSSMTSATSGDGDRNDDEPDTEEEEPKEPPV